ncbi:hypothetical protein BCR39DRAFT_506606 [Naematelia encephala]|uniref:Uncharacterized protein n=1 Tax=Naematelia encephala TaxID=71784 RepID=A0A1Y2AW60_9TREE|nr:hypothetical protein BCR39DRAFT_506606 [Naematelia encephala]
MTHVSSLAQFDSLKKFVVVALIGLSDQRVAYSIASSLQHGKKLPSALSASSQTSDWARGTRGRFRRFWHLQQTLTKITQRRPKQTAVSVVDKVELLIDISTISADKRQRKARRALFNIPIKISQSVEGLGWRVSERPLDPLEPAGREIDRSYLPDVCSAPSFSATGKSTARA